MDANEIYNGNHFTTVYTNIESCCICETNIMLHVNYMSANN